MLHLYIYSLRPISKGTEITIGFDFDYGSWWVIKNKCSGTEMRQFGGYCHSNHVFCSSLPSLVNTR